MDGLEAEVLAEEVEQPFEPERFGEEVVGPGGDALLAMVPEHARRDGNHDEPAPRIEIPQAPRGLEPAHPRHPEIEEDGVGLRRGDPGEAGLRVRRVFDLEADWYQEIAKELPVVGVVVDHQEPSPPSAHADDPAQGSGVVGDRCLRQIEIEPESAPLTRCARHFQRAAHQRDQRLADGQTETRALDELCSLRIW
jgi:hypothetical protein